MSCPHSHFVTCMCTDLLNMAELPRMRAHGETDEAQDGQHNREAWMVYLIST
jgi:hypothetical protein